MITVTTQLPGAAADLVQGFVTQPLQQALANVPGVDYITSASKLGTSTITVFMQLNQSPDAAVANVVATVQACEALLREQAAGRPGGVVLVNEPRNGLHLISPGRATPECLYADQV